MGDVNPGGVLVRQPGSQTRHQTNLQELYSSHLIHFRRLDPSIRQSSHFSKRHIHGALTLNRRGRTAPMSSKMDLRDGGFLVVQKNSKDNFSKYQYLVPQ